LPSSTISDLSLHPVLESILHVLNYDLPSAHFLLRHMQAPPAHKAMFLHGVLHRMEGDLENAWAWYVDVKDAEVMKVVWAGNGAAQGDRKLAPEDSSESAIDHALLFLDGLIEAKTTVCSGKVAPQELTQTSLGEFSLLWALCENKFGTAQVLEASSIWLSMAEKHADFTEKMITGGEGWREF